MFSFLCYYLFVCLLPVAEAANLQPCSLKGPDYLAPRSPSSSSYIKKAKAEITRAIQAALKTGTTSFGDIDALRTSFSIGIYSLHEEQSLFNFNYNGPKLPKPKRGVSKVDANTVYRIGSVSKMLSVYLYLAAIGDKSFNDPITKYVPEFAEYVASHPLGHESSLNRWDFESMTIGSLASQLSDLPRGTIGNFFIDNFLKSLPLPDLPKISPNISGGHCPNSLHIPCTRAAFLENIMIQMPVAPPFYSPSYSNVAYGVMGLILENITGQAMPDLFEEHLVKALHLNATYYAAPPSPNNGIIPYESANLIWKANLRNQSAGGNYYSSVNDMERIGRSILNSSLLPRAMTRRFLSPATFTGRVRSTVGYPWEIFGTRKKEGKRSWIFSKSGSIPPYSTITAILPDWDVGFNVFAAGQGASFTRDSLANIIEEYIVPAIERAAKEEARHTIAGTYRDSNTNSSIVLDVDDGPGVAITEWTAEGTDMIHIWGTLLGIKNSELRLYPNGLTASNGNEIGYTVIDYDADAHNDPKVITWKCGEWTSIDAIPFGRYGLDEISITVDPETRKAISVEPRAFGVALPRK